MTDSIAQAYALCTALAEAHYENFPVGRLMPAAIRPHVHAVYAFARYADDLADEGYAPDTPGLENSKPTGVALPPKNPEERVAALQDWQDELLGSSPVHPYLVATRHTMQSLDLPSSLFTDLISAFQQDCVKRRYTDHAEVLDYCRRSANPIGRLVLYLNGFRDSTRLTLSDHICTGLQLANFWQDVAVDIKKDRIYLPENERAAFGVSEDQLADRRCTPEFRRLLRLQVERTRAIFAAGEALPGLLPGLLKWEIRLTWLGGSAILDKIEWQNFDSLSARPRLTKVDLLPLMLQTILS
jgi:phytoene synthase